MDIPAASDRLSQLGLPFSLDGLTVTVLWFRATRGRNGWFIRQHRHSSYEFHFVAEGSCRVAHAGGEFIARAGQFYLTGPQIWHEQSATDESYVEYCLNCDMAESEDTGPEGRLFLDAFARVGCRPVRDMGSIRCFAQALSEAAGQRAGYGAVVQSLEAMVLALAARAIRGGERTPGRAPLRAGWEDYRFRQIRQFVSDNAGGRITTSDLAGFLYISPRQLGRIVRRHTGQSTQQFIRAARLQRAKQMLRETDFDISEIAARLGFASVYYFSQFFKREEGYSPTEFRHNVRKT